MDNATVLKYKDISVQDNKSPEARIRSGASPRPLVHTFSQQTRLPPLFAGPFVVAK